MSDVPPSEGLAIVLPCSDWDCSVCVGVVLDEGWELQGVGWVWRWLVIMPSMESRLALSRLSEEETEAEELEEERGVRTSWLGGGSSSPSAGCWEGSVGEGYSHCPACNSH